MMLHKVTVYYKDNTHLSVQAYIYFNFECDTMLLDYRDDVNGKWDIKNVYLEEVESIKIDGEIYDTFELTINL